MHELASSSTRALPQGAADSCNAHGCNAHAHVPRCPRQCLHTHHSLPVCAQWSPAATSRAPHRPAARSLNRDSARGDPSRATTCRAATRHATRHVTPPLHYEPPRAAPRRVPTPPRPQTSPASTCTPKATTHLRRIVGEAGAWATSTDGGGAGKTSFGQRASSSQRPLRVTVGASAELHRCHPASSRHMLQAPCAVRPAAS